MIDDRMPDTGPAAPFALSKPPPAMMCRSCGSRRLESFIDLGASPPCESYLTAEALHGMEPHYPLHAWLCRDCWLVQIDAVVDAADIFSEYAYFSSYSDSWLDHARRYVDMIVERLGLDARSQVVELASNDGYLLQYMVARGIPALGVDPAANVAQAAEAKGVPTQVAFFGRETACALVADGKAADLIVANNVAAHVPDLDDFLSGIAMLLKPTGTATIEVAHLLRLIEENQFDTIYHEHYCYYSLIAAETALSRRGLRVFDVEELPTHGGSLRLYAAAEAAGQPESERLAELRAREIAFGMTQEETYRGFQKQAERTRQGFVAFLIEARRAGKRVAGYGAPGKGNTLLNYCGVRPDLLAFTVDRNPYKQGRFLPGSRIPILPPTAIDEAKPDIIVILPWNLAPEITRQLAYTRAWGCRLVVPIPEVRDVTPPDEADASSMAAP